MGQFIVQFFLEIVGFYTAKAILPLLSLGYVRALHSPFVPLMQMWREPSFQRLPQGRIGIKADLAAIIGLLFWVIFIVATHLIFGITP